MNPSSPILPACDPPDAVAIPWLENVRAMIRDRQYEIRQACDEINPKRYPIETAAWDRLHAELGEVAELINRMLYRIHHGESPLFNSRLPPFSEFLAVTS